MKRFKAEGDEVRIRLPEGEREFLAQIVEMLEGVGADSDDPAAQRLNPAVHADADAQASYAELTADDLEASRNQDRAMFREVLEQAAAATTVPAGSAEAWLRVLGEARLALAARWGVINDEGDWERADIPHHRAAVFDYLGILQHELVEVMMSVMAGER